MNSNKMRGTILQPWNWHTPEKDANGLILWKQLTQEAEQISADGYTAVWLPPACKSMGGTKSVGYSISHWSDFNNTKYGNEDDFVETCLAFKEYNIQIYHDIVLNHLMGDEKETGVWCFHVSNSNKNEPAFHGAQWHQRTTYTLYQELGLNHNHFDAIYEKENEEEKCYKLSGKQFDMDPNKDALMGCDLDYDSIDLVEKIKFHGRKNLDKVHTDGYRYDAVKHIRPKGTTVYHYAMQDYANKNLFDVGEYSDSNVGNLEDYLDKTNHSISLFDFPLQRNLVRASVSGNNFNMASVFDNTLVQKHPTKAVTFVHSHDDMPEMHGSPQRGEYIGDWFISQAYAIILLWNEGYPCVSDVDRIKHPDLIKRLILLRTNCTYGERKSNGINHHTTIGWSYTGNPPYDDSMAVILSRGGEGYKWLETGKPNTGYRDFLDSSLGLIYTNNFGWGEFKCQAGKTSVWVEETKYNLLVTELLCI